SMPAKAFRDAIVYQSEPLALMHKWPYFKPRLLEILREAAAVMDYAPANIEVLRGLGVTHLKLVNPGYHPKLHTIAQLDDEPLDVVFYGSPLPQRVQAITELSRWLKVKVVRAFGRERDEWIARGKIALAL